MPLLDLPYAEDSRAQVDLNCVMNEKGELIELQGTGEGRSFTLSEQQELVRLCAKGIGELLEKPVSYTHLDVYKRQATTWRPWLRPGAWCSTRRAP